MAEWLKAHDSKSCGQKCLGGSNPLASAITKNRNKISVFSNDLRSESTTFVSNVISFLEKQDFLILLRLITNPLN